MPLLHEGNMVAGKYRLERSLAKGGMGSLWVARHVQLNMHVAIKFMDTASMTSEEARARFDREAKAAAQIQSPHVAQVHDYGVENGIPYIAMELLHGEDLGHRIRRERRLSLQDVARILAQAAKALRKAHEAGLIHRDLKPANIFLARSDDEEIVKILDFGVVKVATVGVVTEATQTGIVVGSVNYMSPEQARGVRELDHRSDLWSLGVLAFRALTGNHPFPGEQVGDVIVKICSEPIPKPSKLVPALGPEVDQFFERALARDLSDRFQSAREFAEALSLVAGIAPTSSTAKGPPSIAMRAPPSPPVAPFGSASDAAGPPIRPLSPHPTSGAMLTDAARSSEIELPLLPSPWRGARLVAIGAMALAVMICVWLVFRGAPADAPVTAAPSPSLPVTPASAAAALAAELPSSAVSSDPVPSASEKTQAAPLKSSRNPTNGPSSGRPQKGSPGKKINSTLGI
jgi:serine/threonine protein kinase